MIATFYFNFVKGKKRNCHQITKNFSSKTIFFSYNNSGSVLTAAFFILLIFSFFIKTTILKYLQNIYKILYK